MTAAEMNAGHAELHALLESWLKAVRACDVEGITRHYTRDILAFDAVKQLQFQGVEAYASHWRDCTQMCKETTFEIHQLSFERVARRPSGITSPTVAAPTTRASTTPPGRG